MNGIYMEKALALADEAAAEGEIPVGAVIVRRSDGFIAGTGRNRCEKSRNALAHAEIEAIDAACRTLGGRFLTGCDLYVTLEPCPMCAGAAVNARIDRIFFGAYDSRWGACGSAVNIPEIRKNLRPAVTGGVSEQECGEKIKRFFFEMRSKMDKVKLVLAETDDQLRRVEKIAYEIWNEYFPCIISQQQIDYMTEKFCSFDAMKKFMAEEGYRYYFIKKGGKDVGYTAVKPDGDRLFLSKLYLFKDERGKKYARSAMEHIRAIAAEKGLRAVWLTVNKHNDSTIAAYKALGFEIIGEGAADIGNGFVMDDYYMETAI